VKVLGIDPGITGGYALLNGRELTYCDDLPIVKIGTANMIEPRVLAEIIESLNPNHIVIEDNKANGGNGSLANFSMGSSMGVICGVVGTLGYPLIRVRPIDWKRAVGIGTVKGTANERKEAGRQRAIELWPTNGFFKRKKDHNRAEAALIAEWYRRT